MRTLATIRQIDKILPIENADQIEVATMKGLGWQVVTKKGDIKPNDIVVYFEIDSALPIEDRYEFLRKSSYKCFRDSNNALIKECFRLKTITFRGVVSQGLILPVSLFPELPTICTIGMDVSDILKIEHFDDLAETFNVNVKSSVKNGMAAGNFPSCIPKTDQTRIQNLMEYFEIHKDTHFTAESKYDGSSCTVFMVDKSYSPLKFGVCSRNILLKRPIYTRWSLIKSCLSISCHPNNFFKRWYTRFSKMFKSFFGKFEVKYQSKFWDLVNESKLEKALKLYFKKTGNSVALQGEVVGPGINGNRDKYTEHHLFIYDIYDLDRGTYLDAEERHDFIAGLQANYPWVKIEEVDTIYPDIQIFKYFTNLEELLSFVDRNTQRGNRLEGVVFKSIDCKPYVSFKCINNKYLLDDNT